MIARPCPCRSQLRILPGSVRGLDSEVTSGVGCRGLGLILRYKNMPTKYPSTVYRNLEASKQSKEAGSACIATCWSWWLAQLSNKVTDASVYQRRGTDDKSHISPSAACMPLPRCGCCVCARVFIGGPSSRFRCRKVTSSRPGASCCRSRCLPPSSAVVKRQPRCALGIRNADSCSASFPRFAWAAAKQWCIQAALGLVSWSWSWTVRIPQGPSTSDRAPSPAPARGVNALSTPRLLCILPRLHRPS